MTESEPTVFLVDDDPAVLRATSRLLRYTGFRTVAYSSPEEFLGGFSPKTRGCVVLDLAMPGLSGLDLQRALAERGSTLPIIFVTGRGDIPSSVRAMKQGAVDFLTKPVDEADLLAAIRSALSRDRLAASEQKDTANILAKWRCLTPRERQVLEQVVAGKRNKEVAAELGTVEKTIKVHRARVMQKMGAASLTDLVRLADRLGDVSR